MRNAPPRWDELQDRYPYRLKPVRNALPVLDSMRKLGLAPDADSPVGYHDGLLTYAALNGERVLLLEA
jgi:hypothetical protein